MSLFNQTYTVSRTWNEIKSRFSDEGFRPDLNKEIEITDEMKALYNETKSKVVSKAKFVRIFFIFTILLFSFSIDGPVGLIKNGICLAVMVGCLIVYKIQSTNNDVENLEEEYLDRCVKPLIKQYDDNVVVTSNIEQFPLFGQKSEEAELNIPTLNILNSLASRHGGRKHFNDLGFWLRDMMVLPQFNYSFVPDILIDTLSSNKDGFYLINGIAESQYRSDEHTNYVTMFEGTVLAVRMKHRVRSDVSLYTSKKGMFGKENNNGYLKIKDTIDTENDEFNENFEVTADEDSQAFFVLSPLVMENLLAMKEKYKNFGMLVSEDYIVFGLNNANRPLSMPSTVKGAKNLSIEQSAEDVKDLLKMAYEIKDSIDLNFEKFNQ